MTRSVFVFVCVMMAVLSSRAAWAQTEGQFELGVQFATVASGEFDETDVGVGGRFSWHPTGLIGAEAEFNFYPSDFADDPAFSAGRVEGLFGVTAGPRLGRLRPFVKFRPGFVTFQEAPEPFPCILIFPAPLQCALASGETVLAIDYGGGVELFPTDRTFLRIDAGDRALRFPGPARDGDNDVHDDDFFGHEFRLTIGGGWRF